MNTSGKNRSRSSSRVSLISNTTLINRRNSFKSTCGKNLNQANSKSMERLSRSLTLLTFIIMVSIYLLITVVTIGPLNLPPSSPVEARPPRSSQFGDVSNQPVNPRPNVHSRSGRLMDTSSSYKTHSIVFDAGSTGTRIHVFTFRITNLRDGGKKVKLLNEDFKQVKPGLSAYADEPKEAANSLIPLLEVAFKRIPIDKRASTPLTVKATAGLRLLPGDQAESILHEVDSFLRGLAYPFKMDDASSVAVMDGEDEGVFGWFTINFLLNLLRDDFHSVAHLDLGGGSTQITFPPMRQKTFTNAPEGYIVKRNLIGAEKQLYTHSYLGFGLMSSRKGILHRALSNETLISSTSDDNIIRISHPCFPENTKTSWTFEGRAYLIEGVEGDCFKIARDYVTNQGNSPIFHQPKELSDREIYAISYYYDRASDVGLINGTENGGTLRVKDYYLAAKRFCNNFFDKYEPNVMRLAEAARPDDRFTSTFMTYNDASILGVNGIYSENPFICLDLSYITNLLNAGYELGWQKEINIVKKVKGVESSWALGAGISLIR